MQSAMATCNKSKSSETVTCTPASQLQLAGWIDGDTAPAEVPFSGAGARHDEPYYMAADMIYHRIQHVQSGLSVRFA
jgi:hypothetical protein